MSVDELKAKKEKVTIFDAREKAEFDVSHIPGAKYLGYEQFDPPSLPPNLRPSICLLECFVVLRCHLHQQRLPGRIEPLQQIQQIFLRHSGTA
jgi:rhodanese-related sulfurtransferase